MASQANMAFTSGGTLHYSEELATLLRTRLATISLILIVGLGLFMVRGFFLADAWLQALRIVVFLVVVGCYMGLRPAGFVTTRGLRVAELVIFGLVGIQLIAVQARQMHEALASGVGSPATVMTFCFAAWIFVIMTYGMFIPNGCTRAGLLVASSVLTPLVVAIVLRSQNDAFAPFVHVRSILPPFLLTCVAGMASIYGTHRVNYLRRRAFLAKKLGQYVIADRIGAGGMGEVFKAHHALLRRPTAVKIIRSDQADEEHLARFEREVMLTCRLNHPNTICIYDYGRTEEGLFYYAMEYLHGTDIHSLVKTFGPMPTPRVIYVLLQVCDSLIEAHDAGLIHRDIKPANIILCRHGGCHDVVKVIDFGLVKELETPEDAAISAVGLITGSPQFMSPESIKTPQTVTGASDIYAIGATAFYMVTGRHVFEGATAMEICAQHLYTDPKPPSEYLDTPLESNVEAVIMSCLEKDVNERIGSVRALREALAQCDLEVGWTEKLAQEWWEGDGRNILRRCEALGAEPEQRETPEINQTMVIGEVERGSAER